MGRHGVVLFVWVLLFVVSCMSLTREERNILLILKEREERESNV
jgi:hypothetical protein